MTAAANSPQPRVAGRPPAAVTSPVRTRTALARRARPWLAGITRGIVSLGVLLGVWQAAVTMFTIPEYILPPPASVGEALVEGLGSGDYISALAITLAETLAGFVAGSLFGIVVGIMLVAWPTLDRLVFPYIVASQALPKLALAPLMIVWFGFGFDSKVIIVALVSTFPVLVNMIAGLKSTERDRHELMRALCASRWQTLKYIEIPSSLPYLFAGLSSALVLSVLGAIVGEFVGARNGIGVLILKSNFSLDIASVFALLLLLGAMAALLNVVLGAVESRIVFWSGGARGGRSTGSST